MFPAVAFTIDPLEEATSIWIVSTEVLPLLTADAEEHDTAGF